MGYAANVHNRMSTRVNKVAMELKQFMRHESWKVAVWYHVKNSEEWTRAEFELLDIPDAMATKDFRSVAGPSFLADLSKIKKDPSFSQPSEITLTTVTMTGSKSTRQTALRHHKELLRSVMTRMRHLQGVHLSLSYRLHQIKPRNMFQLS